ncbi:CidA/LrgA family protein [Maritimibacter sp. DP07]|uniref:CidA/LrgA family protein n=1 Tax=Maritimibacter harenae TaxID=2606218 RepID=A0A845M590_9RHOB|nr:CidA/LrgA family protein [Maritimibacter harenae]MZR14716.1 CidA/LrgA family protein [Maritimibacter harenae]
MLITIAILFACQLAGETISQALGLPVPGPVLGLLLLFAALVLRPRTVDVVAPVSRRLLAHLSLLFVPAGVGVMAQLDVLARDWFALGLTLVASTVIALLVGVGTFLAVQRLAGERE